MEFRYRNSASVALHMIVLLSILAQVHAEDSSQSKPFSAEVCYPIVGCFNNEWPFDNAYGLLPDSPDVINTVFELYTPGEEEPSLIDYRNMRLTSETLRFDPKVPSKFIIHGFGNSLNKTLWITDMRKAFQANGDYNIILVGWDSTFPHYLKAICNSRVVARLVVLVIEMLQMDGLELSDVHLVGHSLGAHISSYVGHMLSSKISRITGLDPAGPGFDTLGLAAKLDPSDAQFVDVIHSNGQALSVFGGFGLLKQSGHVDFYPNGGEKQPGCKDGLTGGTETLLEQLFQGISQDLEEDVLYAVGCSHGRSYEIFIESITAGSCEFQAYPCPSYDDFIEGKCSNCGPKGCNYAGFQANPSAEGGKQYLLTNSLTPLCSYSVLVTIVPAEEANELKGTLALGLLGTSGNARVILAKGAIDMRKLVSWKRVVAANIDIGSLVKVVLIYNRDSFTSRRNLRVLSLTVETMHNERRFTTSSAFTMRTGLPLHLTMQEDTY